MVDFEQCFDRFGLVIKRSKLPVDQPLPERLHKPAPDRKPVPRLGECYGVRSVRHVNDSVHVPILARTVAGTSLDTKHERSRTRFPLHAPASVLSRTWQATEANAALYPEGLKLNSAQRRYLRRASKRND